MARRMVVGVVATALAMVVSVSMVATGRVVDAAGAAPAGYVIVTAANYSPPCQLAQVDLATGVVTDLPAPPSAEACTRIAVDAAGAVWGVATTVTRLFDDGGGYVDVPSLTLLRFGVDGSIAARVPVGSPPPTFAGGPPAPNAMPGPFTIRPDGTFLFEVDVSYPIGQAPCGVDLAVCPFLYRLDPVTASWSQVGQAGTRPLSGAGIAGCRDAVFVDWVEWQAQDTSTGALTALGPESASSLLGCSVAGTAVYGLQNLQANEDDPVDENEIGTVDRATGVYAGTGTFLLYGDRASALQSFAVGPPPPAERVAAAAATAAPTFTG